MRKETELVRKIAREVCLNPKTLITITKIKLRRIEIVHFKKTI